MQDLRNRLLAKLELRGVATPREELLELHERYISLLTKWNRTINLTSLELEPLSDEAIDRLLVEPIAGSNQAGASPDHIIDLGTGGGSPAIPFWVQLPGSRLTMIESRSRKCAFLNEAVRQIRPGKGMAIDNRFEELLERNPQLKASADILTVRAVRLDEPTSDLIGALLKPTGRVFHFSQTLEITECSTWNIQGSEKRGSS